jgi:DnaJ-class molecular chaperone
MDDDCHYCNGEGKRPSGRRCDNCRGTGIHEPFLNLLTMERERAEKAVDAAWERNRCDRY